MFPLLYISIEVIIEPRKTTISVHLIKQISGLCDFMKQYATRIQRIITVGIPIIKLNPINPKSIHHSPIELATMCASAYAVFA